MHIDSHQHFWNFNAERDAWITDDMKAIQRDFSPPDLAEVLIKNKIDGCVAVQSDQSEMETNFLLSLAERYDFIKGVVGWVDLMADNVGERLSHFSSFDKFKGIRHIVQDEPLGFMEDPNFQRGIQALEAFDLTYDLLIKPPQLEEAIAMTRKFPNQKFVLDHIAKPQISKGIDKQWANGIRELSKHSNLYCKVSGMVTETEQLKWEADDFSEFLQLVTDAFGTDRLMYGSDWPVCLLAASYDQVHSIISNYYAGADLNKVMGENAVRFYNL